MGKIKDSLNNKKNRNNYIAIAIITICLVYMSIFNSAMSTEPERVTYSEFMSLLSNGGIDTVYVDLNAGNIRFAPISDNEEEIITDDDLIITDYPNNDSLFSKQVLSSGAKLEYKSFETNNVLVLISAALPLALNIALFVFIYWMFKKQMNFGTNKQTVKPENISNVHFSDIIGQDEVIEDLKHLIDIMKNRDKYKESNVRIPKGILLVGPPGTGKTMIAKALSNEAGMNFFPVNSAAMIDRFVGMGAKNIRDVFAAARQNTPCIIFFDEIDAIGSNRLSATDNSENRQTINAMLQELDGFGTQDNILVIGATNCYETLDKALVRSGRFDRKISINPPMDAETREKLLKHYIGDMDNTSIDIKLLAKQLSGFTGADIDQVCNEAKLIMVQKGKDILTQDEIEEAIDKTLFNGNRTRAKYEKDIEIVAHHECGHAISLLMNNMPVARISIIPNTSGVGGMVIQQDDDTLFVKKSDLQKRIKSMYSGRIAEELVFGPQNITNGASSDLSQADMLLDKYLKNFAFDDIYGLTPLDDKISQERKSTIAKELYNKAREELKSNLDILKCMAKIIIRYETMDGEKLTKLYNDMVEAKESGKLVEFTESYNE